jgi:hypothetical protein
MGNFRQAFKELNIGQHILQDNFGKFHPLMAEFDQTRA